MASCSFTQEFFLCLCITDRSSSQSAHTAAVGRREPLDCLPGSLSVHERHGLIAGRPTAGVTADLLVGEAPVVRACHFSWQVGAFAFWPSLRVKHKKVISNVDGFISLSYSHKTFYLTVLKPV